MLQDHRPCLPPSFSLRLGIYSLFLVAVAISFGWYAAAGAAKSIHFSGLHSGQVLSHLRRIKALIKWLGSSLPRPAVGLGMIRETPSSIGELGQASSQVPFIPSNWLTEEVAWPWRFWHIWSCSCAEV